MLIAVFALTTVALAVPMQDTAQQDVACFGPYPTAIVPVDGSVHVSPATIPAILLNVDCGAGSVDVTLTPDAGAPVAVTVPADMTGVYRLTDLTLQADTTYVLSVDALDWGTMASTFSTGNAPIGVSGSPSVSVTGAQLSDASNATVSLRVSLAPDPAGAVYELLRDGVVISAGVNGGPAVDAFIGEDGQEVCYSVTQYLGDGSALGTSEAECTTLSAPADVKHGCSTSGADPSWIATVAGLLLGLVSLRRTRA